MMRAHCDRCDRLVNEYSTWVEMPFVHPDGALDTVLTSIWHLDINAGGEQKMFCRTCRIDILEAHVKTLRLVKAPIGGHLADCKWNPILNHYDCVDGCEIKRINNV